MTSIIPHQDSISSRRRIFLIPAAVLIATFACGRRQKSIGAGGRLSFGALTDVHYAEKQEANGRIETNGSMPLRDSEDRETGCL
jgi:hypothetical protein